MLDESFLSGILSNAELSDEDKISQIIGEHNADTRGLSDKKNELLGSEKKLKEQLRAFESSNNEYKTKVTDLETKLKENGSDALKEMYESKINDLSARHKVELEERDNKYNSLYNSHLEDLKGKTIRNAIKDLSFVDGLQNGFIARVMAENDFKAKENENGEIVFYSKDNHTIEEAIKTFATTQEGKAYLLNSSAGGGARGGNNNTNGKATTVTREQFNEMNDVQKAEFCKNGGSIVS